MGRRPPSELMELLRELGLATPVQVAGVQGRVRHLARELPDFQSVWIDALAQARLISPMQAAWLNAGQGRMLRVGAFLLEQALPGPGWMRWYRATRIDGPGSFRLGLVDHLSGPTADLESRLQRLVRQSAALEHEGLLPLVDSGADRRRAWVASRDLAAKPAAEWLVHHGRFPPAVVLEIARQMTAALVPIHRAGLAHADPCLVGLLLRADGTVVLPYPGLRPAVRPDETYADAEVQPEDYDYLAPERFQHGAPASCATDLFGCGCLWWHLLTGRPPLAGASALAKMRSARTSTIPDVRLLAPDTPAELAQAIAACTSRPADARPDSAEALRQRLGDPTPEGRRQLSRCLARDRRVAVLMPEPLRRLGRHRVPLSWLTVALTAAAVVAAAWGLIGTGLLGPSAGTPEAEIATLTTDSSGLVTPLPDTSRSAGPAERAPSATTSPGVADKAGVPAEQPVPPASSEEVLPTAYVQEPPSNQASRQGAQPESLTLPADQPVDGGALSFASRMRVSAPRGQRATIRVPAGGLPIPVSDLCFENIDFVAGSAERDAPSAENGAAFIVLRAAAISFRRCTFTASDETNPSTAALRWVHPVDRDEAELTLPSGRVSLSHCVFRGVRVGIESRAFGTLAVELENVLFLGTGPLLRLDHAPAADEKVVVRMSQLTLRESGPLLESELTPLDQSPGSIAIEAEGCVFAPIQGSPLLRFAGNSSPEAIVAQVRWRGQGSLVVPGTPIAQWLRPDGSAQKVGDEEVAIDGLVRSAVEFADPNSEKPADSQVIRWQAPLRSADPPGADPSRLPGCEIGDRGP